jgi:hypothetical protein
MVRHILLGRPGQYVADELGDPKAGERRITSGDAIAEHLREGLVERRFGRIPRYQWAIVHRTRSVLCSQSSSAPIAQAHLPLLPHGNSQLGTTGSS